MRIGLLTADHLGEEITIQGHSSNGKEFILTGTLLDVEHSFEDDTDYGHVGFIENPLEEEAAADTEHEDLEEDDFEDDVEYVISDRFTEVSLRLSESAEITIELPADHEVTVEPAAQDDEDD